MKTTSTVSLLLCAGFILAGAGHTRPHAEDILTAYRLNETELAQIHAATPDAPAAFWAQWDTDQGPALAELGLLATTDGWNRSGPAFSGELDASLTLRAAYSDSGLYLWSRIVDDEFTSTTQILCLDDSCAVDVRLADAVDIFLDTDGWGSISGGDIAGTFPLASQCSFTQNSTHLQAACGAAPIDSQFRLAHYSLMAQGIKQTLGSRASAPESLDGLFLRQFESPDGSRIQEWYVPWSQFGQFGMYLPPQENDRLGISGGYNDTDPSEGSGLNCVRMLTEVDPATCGQNLSEPRCVPWTDLLMGPSLSPSPTLHPAGGTRQARPPRSAAQWYDIRGRRVGSSSAPAATAVQISPAALRLVR